MESSTSPIASGLAGQVEPRVSVRPASTFLGRFGVLVLLAGLLWAAWDGQMAIAVLLALVLSAAGLAGLWSRVSLTALSCQRLLSEKRVFPGEDIDITLRLVNRKLVPLPWVEVREEIPAALAGGMSLAPGSQPGLGLMRRTAALLWYTRVSWRYRLHGIRRGYYTLGLPVVASGDIFGFYPRSMVIPVTDHIIVYPEIFPIARLGIPSLFPLGEARDERRLFEDPTRTIGVRDYSPDDSLRWIHWKATARHQNLQVKVFEPTSTLKVALFLAVDTFQQGGVCGEDDFELGVSAAASVASYLVERRSLVGLFANTRLADSGQPVRIPPGGKAGQLTAILEALAKVTSASNTPLEDFVQSARGGLTLGTTLVFVLGKPIESLSNLLVCLREAEYRMQVLQVVDRRVLMPDRSVIWSSAGNRREPATASLENSR